MSRGSMAMPERDIFRAGGIFSKGQSGGTGQMHGAFLLKGFIASVPLMGMGGERGKEAWRVGGHRGWPRVGRSVGVRWLCTASSIKHMVRLLCEACFMMAGALAT